MEENWCELLRVQAVPHIFEADNAKSTLQIEGIIGHVSKDSIPIKLGKQISNLESRANNADRIDYFTIFHIGKPYITETSEYVKLELMLQPYIFFDAVEPKDYNADAFSGIYTLDSFLAENSIKQVPGNIQVNPSNIENSKIISRIDSRNQSLPSTTKFELSTHLPVQVFYTLTLVPYMDKIARILICKHVIVFNESSPLGRTLARLTQADSFLDKIDSHAEALKLLASVNPRDTNSFELDAIQKLSELLQGYDKVFTAEKLKDRFFYYIWNNSGKPDKQNFGQSEYDRLLDASFKELPPKIRWNLETEFLNKCFGDLLEEIFRWVREI